MLEAINDGLRRFVDFKGRSNKLQFNSFLLFYILIDLFINLANPHGLTINNIIMAALTVPLIAVEIRRSHDVGKSGWWILVPLDRKSTRLNSSHSQQSRMPSSA